MKTMIQPLPKTWPHGNQEDVIVTVTNATPGARVDVDLSLTTPAPQQQLGHRSINADNAGNAAAMLPVTLSTPGINVLHADATSQGSFASHSAGTIVT